MASPTYVSPQEKKDLEKYIKFFVIKAVQIIVQSRLGERVLTPCRTDFEGSDWFNLGIRDVQEVLTETKKTLSGVHVLDSHTINVEISLRTTDGDSMILEVWSATMNSANRHNTKISYAVYNRLGTLLRSLLCITRAVRTYKLSRTQSAESFVICYRVYHGTPDLSHLGSKEQKLNIGTVTTPLGSVGLTAVHRTQMMLSPSASFNKDLEMKENYFTNETATLHTAKACHNILAIKQLNQQCGQHADSVSEFPDNNFATSPPDGALVNFYNDAKSKDSVSSKGSPYNKIFKLGNSSSDNTDSSGSGQNTRTPDKTRKTGAFAPRRASQISLDEDVPFSILLEMSQQATQEPKLPAQSESMTFESVTRSVLDEPDFKELEQAEEFDFVELKTPFAVPDIEADLGRFYRKCKERPELRGEHSGETYLDTIDGFDVEQFEKNMSEFDDFFTQLNIQDLGQGSPV